LSFHQSDDDLMILIDGDLAQQVLVKDHFLGGDHEISVQPNGGFTQSANNILALLTPLDTGAETPDPETPDPEMPGNEVDLSGDNNITGSINNDVIASGDGQDTLIGLSGNDALIGGKGDDLYLVGSDSGSDTIVDYEGNNIIRFTDGISFNDVASGLSKSDDDLVLKVGSTGNEVRIERFFTLANTIQSVEFESGGSISAGQLYGAFGMAAPVATEISGDVFVGNSADNTVTAGSGNDVLIAGAGNDSLQGLEGNDQLVGGDGDDTYRIGANSGSDTIIDTAGSNKILFTDGISFNDVASGLMKSGNDLILKVGSTGNEVRITQFFAAANTIEGVEFETGGALSAAQLFGAFGVTPPDQTVSTESGFGIEALTSAMSSFDVPDDAGSPTSLSSNQGVVEETMSVA
jgi:Ca2+-binding RTX toxin-like protein